MKNIQIYIEMVLPDGWTFDIINEHLSPTLEEMQKRGARVTRYVVNPIDVVSTEVVRYAESKE